jgi:hypothetical protein
LPQFSHAFTQVLLPLALRDHNAVSFGNQCWSAKLGIRDGALSLTQK